jgi:hypothetical protein
MSEHKYCYLHFLSRLLWNDSQLDNRNVISQEILDWDVHGSEMAVTIWGIALTQTVCCDIKQGLSKYIHNWRLELHSVKWQNLHAGKVNVFKILTRPKSLRWV